MRAITVTLAGMLLVVGTPTDAQESPCTTESILINGKLIVCTRCAISPGFETLQCR